MIKQVIIFAGGKGERMMPLSSNKPKCLIKLSKKPFIEYLLEQIENLKVKEVIILVGYKSKKILEYLKLKKYNFKIITKYLDEKFETSKRILNIKKLLKKEFMIMYSDVYCEHDILKSYKQFKKNNFDGQITVFSDKYKFLKRSNIKTKNKIVVKYSKKIIPNFKNTGMDIGYSFFKKKIFKKKFNQNLSFQKLYYNSLISKHKLSFYETDVRYTSLSRISELNKAKNYFTKKYIFLDRDGVINHKPKKLEYVDNINKFKWKNEFLKFIKNLKNKNTEFIVISNQAGVARKKLTKNILNQINILINKKLKKYRLKISAFYYCTHHWNENCMCRKPKPGLIMLAQNSKLIKFSNSIFIGDSETDEQAAKNLNINFFKVVNKKSFDRIKMKISKKKFLN